MDSLQILGIGFVFGLLISYGKMNRYDTIAAQSVFAKMNVMKTIAMAMGVGSILIMIEMSLGLADFHVKPFMLGGTLLGGLIFGIGMALAGYCPGTMPISVGQGSVDALVGILGGLVGGAVFTVLYEPLSSLMTVLSKDTLFTLMGSTFSLGYQVLVVVLGIAFILATFVMHKLDVKNGHVSKAWVVTGVGLGVLNTLLFYKGWQDKPLGASTSYPFVADNVFGLTDYEYYPSTIGSGQWQIWFLLGALIAGLIYAVATKSFKIEITHEFWNERRGTGKANRLIWAFIGGFLLILGARLADGCTSGHFLSGGMQFALSSYAFMVPTMIGFLVTGKLFYSKK
ncbi:MAG: YeeE/YedE thiosulfate transporter family protein [Arcanobacterium sp.]